jgi:hypothetical protein
MRLLRAPSIEPGACLVTAGVRRRTRALERRIEWEVGDVWPAVPVRFYLRSWLSIYAHSHLSRALSLSLYPLCIDPSGSEISFLLLVVGSRFCRRLFTRLRSLGNSCHSEAG